MHQSHLLRRAVASLVLAGAVGVGLWHTAFAAESNPPAAGTGVYRMQLGQFKIVALSDGVFDLPTDQLLIEDRPGAVKTLLDQAGLPSAVPTSVNAFLIDTGARQVLVDAGSGRLLGPALGQVVAHLRAAGYAPEQIDDVLITHLHPDHFGGMSADGQRVFANATVHVDRRELAFWLDKRNQSKVDAAAQGSFDGAIAALQPYQAAGRVKTFDAGAEPMRGITALAMDGHTAGHTVYRVRSQGQTLLMWGDVVHVAAVQFADPKVTIHFDSTPAQAEAAREHAYADAAAKGYLVAASHIAFPGIGKVEAKDGGYVWAPVAASGR